VTHDDAGRPVTLRVDHGALRFFDPAGRALER
jgi:hypothetical protein